MSRGCRIGILVTLAVLIVLAVGLRAYRGSEVRHAASQEQVAAKHSKSHTAPQVGPAASASKKTEGLPKLVDVGAAKCIPCKMMAPVLDELAKEYRGKLKVVVIDLSENPEAASKYGVRMIPTQIFYDRSGKEFYRHMGFFSKEDILKTFEEHGIHLSR